LLSSRDIRRGFIEFFQSRGHTYAPSVPVIPLGDPTLLFINAGMNQFKDVFLGMRTPAFTRAVNAQKCLRVSGKHNDLEEVGPSNRHHTFFEMLGNWSFGDYYKLEAIKWGWELVTEVWKFPKDRLYATVYTDDDEAFDIWKNETDINPAHISRHGKKDNFWEMGEIGPCGPCSEIHFDLGPDGCDKKGLDHQCEANGVCGRILEIWNLVFIQYNRDDQGVLHELPAKHVDTGAGLERISSVLQGGLNNYDSDLFQPLIAAIVDMSGVPYGDVKIPHRVISDHLRALAFAIADGALPSNEGRGYVLRRILRRAARFGHEIGLNKPFIHKLVPVLVDTMGDVYPEIREKHQHISLVVKNEEEGFSSTLERGLEIFQALALRAAEGIIPGEDAFKLYDTYGFPLDLTQLMAREKGLTVDTAGFETAMQNQRERARSQGKFTMGSLEKTAYTNLTDYTDKPAEQWQTFVGYDFEEFITEVVKYRVVNEYIEAALKDSPFYPESGGQTGDTGKIVFPGGETFTVEDTYLDEGSVRIVKITGDVKAFQSAAGRDNKVTSSVDSQRRMAIRRNHTATHLLQYALRKIIGSHIQQAGSLVHPDYLRFDYTHYQKPETETLFVVEKTVQEAVMANLPVTSEITTLEAARAKGAMALFGEKYGETVRMISTGDISRELCGGTHCRYSGDIGFFRITSETGVSAGVRRIEAVTGHKALDLLMKERADLERVREILHSHGSEVVEKLQKFAAEKKELEKEAEKLRKSGGGMDLPKILSEAEILDGAKIVTKIMTVSSMDELKDFGDVLRDNLKSGIGFIAAELEGKAAIVCVVTDDLIKKGVLAGKLVGKAAEAIGGKGGGRPHLATAGAKSAEKLEDALTAGKRAAIDSLRK